MPLVVMQLDVSRILWATATALAIWGVVFVSLGQLQRYNESPTVVTLEKDFRSWEYSLPAITACSKNRTDPSKLEAVIFDRWRVAPSDEKYWYYCRFVDVVAHSSLLSLGQFQEFAADDTLDVDLFQLAKDVMPESDIKTTMENRQVQVKWIPIMTEFGACFSINSFAVEDTALVKMHPNDTVMYPLNCKYGGISSCHVIVEVYDTYEFFYHSPFDILDATASSVTSNLGTLHTLELSVLETTSGWGVRDLTPARRACLFNDEPIGNRKVYSTNACRQTCRSKLALKLCKCVPFYYFYEDGPACSTSGMACLAKFAQNLSSFGNYKCACGMQCLYSVFREISIKEQTWDQTSFTKSGTIKYVVQPPKIRYIREIVFHFQDLVVSFGGATGLFLGASVISFAEIVYFLLDRVLRAVSVNNNQLAPVNENEKAPTFEEQRVKELTAMLHGYKHGQDRTVNMQFIYQ